MAKKGLSVKKARTADDSPHRATGADKEAKRTKGLYLVRLKDGTSHLAAVVAADTPGEAKDLFVTLCGIIGTEHPITAEPVADEHGYTVDDNGVVTAGL